MNEIMALTGNQFLYDQSTKVVLKALTFARFIKSAIFGAAGSVGLIFQATRADSEVKIKPLTIVGIRSRQSAAFRQCWHM